MSEQRKRTQYVVDLGRGDEAAMLRRQQSLDAIAATLGIVKDGPRGRLLGEGNAAELVRQLADGALVVITAEEYARLNARDTAWTTGDEQADRMAQRIIDLEQAQPAQQEAQP